MTDDKPQEINLQSEKIRAEFSPHAKHDPKTGMYIMPEPETNKSGFVESEVGGHPFFMPVPSMVSVRIIRFESQAINVMESLDVCTFAFEDSITAEDKIFY